MKHLPTSLTPYQRTPEFTEDSIPAGLLGAHQTKPGTWAHIVVLEGQLLYRILEPSVSEVHLSAQRPGVVEPEVRHQVQADGAVRFYVQFYR